MNILTEGELAAALETLPAWTLADGALQWQKRFTSFSAAFAFLTRVASLAEAADHHPDVTLSYDRLTLRLLSHDVGGLTTRDLELAVAIGALEAR